ncbi:MAG: hypothetical protein P1U74_01220 [Legionellaceae bacterium]|nr:hypothetical protein [Legionellaceae bacterium]
MLRKLVYLVFFLSCSAFAEDANFYKMNPQKIQKELTSCPKKHLNGVSCDELNGIASHINDLAISLQLDPQGYGITILKMQEKLAKMIDLENKQQNDVELLAEINKNQQDINERLAIIKWLESPVKH